MPGQTYWQSHVFGDVSLPQKVFSQQLAKISGLPEAISYGVALVSDRRLSLPDRLPSWLGIGSRVSQASRCWTLIHNVLYFPTCLADSPPAQTTTLPGAQPREQAGVQKGSYVWDPSTHSTNHVKLMAATPLSINNCTT
jgi:hypothetical protein